MTLQNLFTTVATLQESVNKYQTKPTKAESKRIRKQLTELRKGEEARIIKIDK